MVHRRAGAHRRTCGRHQQYRPRENVILFIADGNGVGSNYATRLWVGQKKGGLGDDYVLPQEMFPNVALVKTYTTNGQSRIRRLRQRHEHRRQIPQRHRER